MAYTDDYAMPQEQASGPSEEDILETVRQAMGQRTGGYDPEDPASYQFEGDETPTQNDVMYLLENRDKEECVQHFTEQFGEEITNQILSGDEMAGGEEGGEPPMLPEQEPVQEEPEDYI